MAPKPQNIDVDHVRFSAPWAAWWAMFLVVCTCVWYVKGAKSVLEQVVYEVKEIRVEMRMSQQKQHELELEIKGIKTKLGISATFSAPVVTAAK
jgi:hypothetical protein